MKGYLKAKELAARWGIHDKSLARWRMEKKGPPFVKLGEGSTSPVYYKLKEILKWERKKGISQN